MRPKLRTQILFSATVLGLWLVARIVFGNIEPVNTFGAGAVGGLIGGWIVAGLGYSLPKESEGSLDQR